MVTVKLAQQLYEKLGEDTATELVNWLNHVGATARADLRELNELNFSRFDAKLEQRLAESDAKWERRFADFDTKWERRFAEFDTKWERRLAEVRNDMIERFAQLESRLTWRMFAFWAPTALAVIGTGAGVVSLLLRR